MSQAPKEEESDAEGLRVKLRGAIKKGKAIEKQRAELEAQVSALQKQVMHVRATHTAISSQTHGKTDCLLWRTRVRLSRLMSPFAEMWRVEECVSCNG